MVRINFSFRKKLEKLSLKTLTRIEEHILLAILNLKENAYLVTIRDYLIENAKTDQSFGTLYVALTRLEQQGYILNYIGEATAKRGGKAIKYFELTDAGKTALQEVMLINEKMWINFNDLV